MKKKTKLLSKEARAILKAWMPMIQQPKEIGSIMLAEYEDWLAATKSQHSSLSVYTFTIDLSVYLEELGNDVLKDKEESHKVVHNEVIKWLTRILKKANNVVGEVDYNENNKL